MSKVVKHLQPYWKTFRASDRKNRWFYTDSAIKIEDMPWFNKNTWGITVNIGYETEEYSTQPIKPIVEETYEIIIEYQIANYFGDTSGMHFRHKNYMLIGGKMYKQDDEGSEVVRITKELRGVLEIIQNITKE